MSKFKPARTALFRGFAAVLGGAALSGCHLEVMNPQGWVAQQQANLILISTGLMLLIIIPVMLLTLVFAWRYRASNTQATYTPEWDHSTRLELLIWGAPLLIIVTLGSITWISTHKLDPYRPLDQISQDSAVAPGTKPLEIDVVALDWKWLFIYPGQGVGAVNELVIPANQPVKFRITSSTVMNTFYVPTMAGMIYAMPGMETQLNAVINTEGNFKGMSANYSGAGFSDMHFPVRSVSASAFDQWVKTARSASDTLGRSAYLALEQPSKREAVRYFGKVEDGLFAAVLDRCVDSEKMCASTMMAIDEQGGLGKGSVRGVVQKPLMTASGLSSRSVVSALCTAANSLPEAAPLPAPAAQPGV